MTRSATAVSLLLIIAAVLLVRGLVVTPVRVTSASMEPVLAEGEVVLISRTPPDPTELERWDLVVLTDPRDGSRSIKRVVGLPGEDVVILDGVLHIDGLPAAEPWVDPDGVDGDYSRTFRVPAAHVFVLGDNRGNSIDSRDYGALGVGDLRGRVLLDP